MKSAKLHRNMPLSPPSTAKKSVHANSSSTIQTSLFWDLHLHGLQNHDFLYTKPTEILDVCEALGKQGIGFFTPTLLTSKEKEFHHALKVWGQATQKFFAGSYSSQKLPKYFALPLGLHCEGPFLNPEMTGAHPLKNILPPSVASFKKMLADSHHHIRILTLAPEMPGALELISFATKSGVRVQLGHSHCTLKQATQAHKAGARGITHLFNAMRYHHRDPGLLGLLLAQKQVTAEMIVDLAHVHPEFACFFTQKLSDQVYAVSDACSQKSLGELAVYSKKGLAYIKKTKTIAGSTLLLSQCPAKWMKTGIQFSDKKIFFELFYKIQQNIFSSQFQKLKKLYPQTTHQKLFFDAKSFKFLKRQ